MNQEQRAKFLVIIGLLLTSLWCQSSIANQTESSSEKLEVNDKKLPVLGHSHGNSSSDYTYLRFKENVYTSLYFGITGVGFALGAVCSGFCVAAGWYLFSKFHSKCIETELEKPTFYTVYLPGQIETKLSDVAGMPAAKADIQDILSYLENPDLYKNIGAKVPKGVLLNGRPGNGKTLLAQAIAGQVNCPFVSVSGSAFVEMYVGAGSLHVRQIFSHLRKLAAEYGVCILFIDEIDSLVGNRGAAYAHAEYTQTLNALLVEMDGMLPNLNPIIVIGATNRIEAIDNAVLRPGRFDRIVNVDNPFLQDRVELLNIALKKVNHMSDININRIALATRGFSGAELAHLVNEAAILAANAGKKYVQAIDIDEAFDMITLGRKISTMQYNSHEIWNTAVHEAGHAMMLLLTDLKHGLYKVTIEPRGKALGVMYKLPLYESYESNIQDMEHQIMIALAGRIAEEEFGISVSSGAVSDLKHAHEIAYNMVAHYGMADALRNISYSQLHELPNDIGTQVEREVQKIIDSCTDRAKKIIAKNHGPIDQIAQRLVEMGTLSGEEIYNLLSIPVPQGIEFSLA